MGAYGAHFGHVWVCFGAWFYVYPVIFYDAVDVSDDDAADVAAAGGASAVDGDAAGDAAEAAAACVCLWDLFCWLWECFWNILEYI